jgi:hypothetical protein
VRTYGETGLVRIASTAEGFAAAVEAALVEDAGARLRRADELLADLSWDETWRRMWELVEAQLGAAAREPDRATAAAGVGGV